MAKPEPGFWAIRLVRDGPEVPCCILEHETRFPGDRLAAYIMGERCEMHEVWHRRGRAITKADHDFMVADLTWLRTWKPNDPMADPTKAIDPLKAPPPF